MKKSEFAANAKPVITITIDGQPIVANVKEFSTGSVGYNANGKVTLMMKDGTPQKYQVSMNIMAVGSKEWEK